jgi:hypothetical protein
MEGARCTLANLPCPLDELPDRPGQAPTRVAHQRTSCHAPRNSARWVEPPRTRGPQTGTGALRRGVAGRRLRAAGRAQRRSRGPGAAPTRPGRGPAPGTPRTVLSHSPGVAGRRRVGARLPPGGAPRRGRLGRGLERQGAGRLPRGDQGHPPGRRGRGGRAALPGTDAGGPPRPPADPLRRLAAFPWSTSFREPLPTTGRARAPAPGWRLSRAARRRPRRLPQARGGSHPSVPKRPRGFPPTTNRAKQRRRPRGAS